MIDALKRRSFEAKTESLALWVGAAAPGIPSREPPLAVIVAVRGVSNDKQNFFKHLLAHAYSKFHLIVSVEWAEDPAYHLAAELAQDNKIAMSIVVTGMIIDWA